ncbi:growth-regulated alpha protein-like [Anguilla rostrata]|uniref:growth-regulated alpha protein-like n=1 Tax=Anguilla rostrata TaxID=7938 RepID=UPI0030D3278F
MPARKICAVFSSLLLFWVAWADGDMRGRCVCPNKVDAVHPKRVADITVLQKDAFCGETQIILTLKQNGEVCLNPDSEQGRNIQECWRSHDMDPEKTKACLRKKKTTH